ncbi:kinase-like protein [Linnemannia elongata AG-77]|uniref:Kinase-like protein n=1 Tax=Linnemannia elongata AG-77 TaxID=1314771 RepID=A0A197JTJ6_9FUNG|nr:kinase-like protein [Linnemannia elongata AG-77]
MSAEPSKRKKPSSPATPPSQNVSPSSVPPSPVRPRPGRPSPESPSSRLRLVMGSPGSPTRPPPALPSHLLSRPPGAAPSFAAATVRPPRPSPSPMGPPRPTRPSPSPMRPPRPPHPSPSPMGPSRPTRPLPSPRRAASSSSFARPQLVMSEQLPFCFGAANRYRRYPAPHPARPHPRPPPIPHQRLSPHLRPPQSARAEQSPGQVAASSSSPSSRAPSPPSREQLPALFRPTENPQAEGSSTRRSRRLARLTLQETPVAPPTQPLKIPSTSSTKPLPPSISSSTAPSASPSVAPGAVPTEKDKDVPIEPLERYLDGRGNEFTYTATISSWERERDAYRIASRPDPEHPDGRHPGAKFLLKCFESFEYEGQLVLVLELAKESLVEYFNRRSSKISRQEIQDLIRDICRGLDCLHSKGVVHRDIKPENILLSESRGSWWLILEWLAGGYMGTHGYMAPEITTDKSCRYRMSVDMYSLGVLIHTLVSLKTPEKSDTTKEPINAIEGWDEAKMLVDGLLQEVPEDRWTIQKVLGHSFFREVQANVNAKGDSLEREESVEARDEDDGGIQVEGDLVPAVESKAGKAGCARETAAPEKDEDEVEKKDDGGVEKKVEDEIGQKVEGSSTEKKD